MNWRAFSILYTLNFSLCSLLPEPSLNTMTPASQFPTQSTIAEGERTMQKTEANNKMAQQYVPQDSRTKEHQQLHTRATDFAKLSLTCDIASQKCVQGYIAKREEVRRTLDLDI